MAGMWRMEYYGSATLGERGQIVIPADARRALELEAGEKMVIFGAPGGRLVIVKADAVSHFVTEALNDLTELERKLREEAAPE